MPLFEFNCRRCGRTFEEILSLAELETEPPACPACGADQAVRAFSRFATGGGGASAGGGGGCGSSGFT
jgi:putative FmdB family regulatory protein